jgi:GNAT superfamily N-acetyltransferase
MAPEDGPGLARLSEQSPDTGEISFTACYHVDAVQTLKALWPDSAGVVAEPTDSPGTLVGMGLVSFGRCRFEGEERPYALLSSLKVHPQYRRQGVAARLATWRIEEARGRVGRDGVILANIQKNNTGSIANARKWATQIAGQFVVSVNPMRARAPRAKGAMDISVRVAREGDLPEIVAGLNRFYGDHNLSRADTVESLRDWLRNTPFADPFRHYLVAVTSAGQIIAGVALTEECRLRTMVVGHMPTAMRVASRLLRLLPPDGVVREVLAERLWFAPGQAAAARHLWEGVRWQWRGRGTTLMAFFDPRGPLPGVIRQPLWVPRGRSTLALNAPVPLREETLLSPLF